MEHSLGNRKFVGLFLLLCVFGSCPSGVCGEEIPQASPNKYPFCITQETLEEYKADLPEGVKILGSHVTHIRKRLYQSRCPECPLVGLIDNVGLFRIRTNLDKTNFPIMEFLRQWIHIHIKTTNPAKGLVVQANVAPYAMAYGNFDLEFACTDCGDDIKLDDAIEGKALTLEVNGIPKAAAIPCRRRTYIHIRHPYVYAYAHNQPRRSFHMNYNYLDITCRKTEMIQFMFLVVKGKSASYGKSSVIDHGFVDSVDGMPYPYHVDFHNKFTCHDTKFGFENAGNGDKIDLAYLKQYDDCILASPREFTANYKDTKNFISNKVCNWPERSKCNYSDPDNIVDPTITEPGGKTSTEVCRICDGDDNQFSREAYRRLIRRTYKVRRVHGVSMIFGMVALGVISIHVSRYLKETGGGCLLVGWWLWAHVGLTHAAKGAVYIGLVLGLCQPNREPTEENGVDIEEKRNQLIKVHKLVGAIAVFLLHVECITGPIRPSAPTLRSILVLIHVVVGYLSVLVAFVATIYSTACFDVVLHTILIMMISFIIWIIGTVVQILADSANKLNPARKLFPVIEAVKVTRPIPMKIPRLVLLGVLVVLTMVFVLLMSFKGGYKGIIFSDPCVNCIWKYDDTVIVNFNKKTTSTEPMYSQHKCSVREGLWDSMLSLPRSQEVKP